MGTFGRVNVPVIRPAGSLEELGAGATVTGDGDAEGDAEAAGDATGEAAGDATVAAGDGLAAGEAAGDATVAGEATTGDAAGLVASAGFAGTAVGTAGALGVHAVAASMRPSSVDLSFDAFNSSCPPGG